MNATLALARAASGTALEQIDVTGLEPRYTEVLQRMAGQNGHATEVLAAWTRTQPDGADILRAVLAVDPLQAAPERGAARFRLISAAEMKARPAPESLVEEIFMRASMAVLAGPPGSYKSFLAADVVLSIAAGIPLLGRKVTSGPTVYVTAEGGAGMGLRIDAWERARSVPAPAQCHFIDEAVQLWRTQDVDALLDSLMVLPAPPVAIVFDTLARCMVGGDENSQRDMGLLIDGAERVKRATGATPLLIHHSNKAGSVRGSSALPGGVDTELEMTADGAVAVLRCNKQKDSEKFKDIYLTRQIVGLPDGQSSVVLKETDRRIDLGTPLGASVQKAEQVLTRDFGSDGATATEWQKACIAAGIPDGSFFRLRKELVERGRVTDPGIGKGGRYRAADGVTSNESN